VLVVAGSRGKTGAAAMSAPELMTEPLPETLDGTIAPHARLDEIAAGKTVIAMGPGLGRGPEIESLARAAAERSEQPLVLDADALVTSLPAAAGRLRVLTPHPGEMARLTSKTTAEVLGDRLGAARGFAHERGVTLVLKGQRTLIAFSDGRVWINPTGTPALGTGGTGDVLTGMISGFLAQFPQQPEQAIAAAVYLHGLAAQLGARALGEKCLIATDVLRYLPEAMEACAAVPDGI
jgi:NAD(P)H-hydrate epimerase